MKLSIIIPAYHIEDYLENCVESIVRQNYENCELIIVDDGSKDKTGDIADSIKEKYRNNYSINVIHQENKGLGGARNTGIMHSKGEYIMFLDGDDLLVPNSLMILDKIISNNNIDVLCFELTNIKAKDWQDNTIKIINSNSDETQFRWISPKEYLISCGISACNKIYRRSLFKNRELFFPEKLLYEDAATIPKIVLFTDKIAHINAVLYLYVQRPGSIISAPQPERLFEIFQGYDGVIDLFNQKGKMDLFYYELEWCAILHCYYYTLLRTFSLGLPKEKYIEKVEHYIISRFPNYKNNLYILDESYITKNIRDCFRRKYCVVALRNYGKHYLRKCVQNFINKTMRG